MNQPSERLERLLSFLEQDNTNLNLLLDITDLCLQLADPRAAEYASQALGLAPTDSQVRYLYGVTRLQRQEFAAAEAIFQKLLDEKNDDVGIRYNLALSQAYQGRMEQVSGLLEPIAGELLHDIPHGHLLYCRAVYHDADLDTARALLRNHIERYPDSSEAMGLLAMLYSDLGEHESAQALAENALRLNPDNTEALITIGSVDLENYDFENAERCFTTALEHNPNSGRSLLGKGLVAMVSNHLPEAEALLTRTVAAIPSHLGSWSVLGWSQILQNKLAAAEQTFRKSLELDGNFGETHGGLACALMMQGKMEDALREAKIANRLDPDSFAGRYAEVLAQQARNNPGQAAQEMQNLLQSPVDEGGATLLQSLQAVATKFNSTRFNSATGTAPESETSDPPTRH